MKRRKAWRIRMSCDGGEVTECLENELCYDYNYELCSFSKLSVHFIYVTAHSDSPSFPSLHLRDSSFSNLYITLPTSQLILQPFRCFTYVTAHSPTILSPLLRHKIFTYVTWRAAHGLNCTLCLKCTWWRDLVLAAVQKVASDRQLFTFLLSLW